MNKLPSLIAVISITAAVSLSIPSSLSAYDICPDTGTGQIIYSSAYGDCRDGAYSAEFARRGQCITERNQCLSETNGDTVGCNFLEVVCNRNATLQTSQAICICEVLYCNSSRTCRSNGWEG